MRVRVVEPLDVREDDHKVGLDEARHERRERVVVAEADLLDRHGVVLVHHGHHAQLQKARERVARVQVGTAVRRVATREQHDRRHDAMGRERLGVGR